MRGNAAGVRLEPESGWSCCAPAPDELGDIGGTGDWRQNAREAPPGKVPDRLWSSDGALGNRTPAEAPVARLKREYRYQFPIRAASRKALNEALQQIRRFALGRKWGATALAIDVDPLTLM